MGAFAGHKGAGWSCQLDAMGSLAATAGGDFIVQVWDAVTGQSLHQTVDFLPLSHHLEMSGHEGILKFCDLTEPKKAPAGTVQSAKEKITIDKCTWLSDAVILVGCADSKVRFW